MLFQTESDHHIVARFVKSFFQDLGDEESAAFGIQNAEVGEFEFWKQNHKNLLIEKEDGVAVQFHSLWYFWRQRRLII